MNPAYRFIIAADSEAAKLQFGIPASRVAAGAGPGHNGLFEFASRGRWTGTVPEYHRIAEEPHAADPAARPGVDVVSGDWFRRVARRVPIGSVFR